jgi:hypothetical protein
MSELEKSADAATTEPTREKGSLAPVGVLAVLLAPVVILTSLFFSYSEVGDFDPPATADIKISVVISSSRFLEFSSGNVCDGSGETAGLSRATIKIGASGWSQRTTLGEGSLNSQGRCEYEAKVSPPSSFLGGNVRSSVVFSFGETDDFTTNIGDSIPFKGVNLEINLG